MLFSAINKTYQLLNSREKKFSCILLGGMFFTAIIQLSGIVSVFPFIAVVSDPEIVKENKYLNELYEKIGFANINNFLIFLGCIVLIFIIIGNFTLALKQWFQIKFVMSVSGNLQISLMKKYLFRPYSFYLDLNTSILNKKILHEIQQVTEGVIIPLFEIFTYTLIALLILILIIIVDPLVSFLALIVLGGSYSLTYFIIRKKLSEMGKSLVIANSQRYKISSEVFGSIKDVKLMGKEQEYTDKFAGYVQKINKNLTYSRMTNQLPFYILEVISIGGVLALVLYLLISKGSIGDALPLIVLYVFAAYRLKPALNKIFNNVTIMKFNIPALKNIYNDVFDKKYEVDQSILAVNENTDPMHLKSELELKSITFNYPDTQTPALFDINLKIKANTSVAFTGSTGSGKTTLVDIILGLFTPTSGNVYIDGNKINKLNLRSWQKNIGYVSQHIYLSDNSIKSNIAFGVPDFEVDMKAVEQAAKIANLHDYIHTLTEKYETQIGEKGLKMSGGQLQRIAIARALYYNPGVLIMDEATNALDKVTESAILEALQTLSGKKTIIMIAHRFSTVMDCDNIFIIENGRITGQGNYKELIETNEKFRLMAQV